ncbi:hypothetical protein [Aliarcobacter butzleri]|uniref:hypothetical protein n=1 Tax=Aliarcobacter butzleri TaxID=28197 RepID=UPI0012F86A03|nr:hypothetical protein [Aliarcobacter butzleri]
MNEVDFIIDKYFSLYSKILGIGTLTEGLTAEGAVTITSMVPYDFFNDEKTLCVNKDIKYRQFGEVFILFNDLKDSTKILEQCEINQKEYIYTGYIYYSTKLLAEILDLLGGKIVEITGDGNYSIIQKTNFNQRKFIELNDELGRKISSDIESEDLRLFISNLFDRFNGKISKVLKENYYNFNFLIRVGCKFGNCKITRFEIDGHVKQDKLIGSIVNKAAHQAMEK